MKKLKSIEYPDIELYELPGNYVLSIAEDCICVYTNFEAFENE